MAGDAWRWRQAEGLIGDALSLFDRGRSAYPGNGLAQDLVPEMKTMAFPLEVKELTDEGQVEGYASIFGNVDKGGGAGGGGDDAAPGKLRFSLFYKGGTKAGFTPRQVDEMTLWEFTVCMEGLAEFHGAKPQPPAPDAEWMKEAGIVGFENE